MKCLAPSRQSTEVTFPFAPAKTQGTFFTWKWNFIKLENKTAAPGKALEGSYFHSVFCLVKDPTEREIPAQCGSGSGSICCEEWDWGMSSLCGTLLLTWVASLQTARREPPGVWPKGRRSSPRRRTARGEPVGACRRQPGRGVRRAVHVPWEPAAQGRSMWPAGVALCGCLSLGCFQACSCTGLEAEQLCLRNLLVPGGRGQASVQQGDGRLWRQRGFIIPESL